MKTRFLLLILTLLSGCCRENEQAFDMDRFQDTIRAVQKMSPGRNEANVISGIWKSKNSDSLLLVGKDGRAVVLIVSSIGNIQQSGDGEIKIKRTDVPLNTELFGTLKNGKLYRHSYDSMEVFEKKD